MQLPLVEVSKALQLQEWLQGSSVPLAIAAHPSGLTLAFARGCTLVVVQLGNFQHVPSAHVQLQQHTPQQQQTPACHLHQCKQQVTAVAWFVHLERSKGSKQPFSSTAAHPECTQQPQTTVLEPHMSATGHPKGMVDSLLESELLLSGTATGHLQLHTADGLLLYRQRLLGSAVLDIIVRPYCSGLHNSEASEDICVTFSHALVRINTLDIRALIKMLQLAQQGDRSAAATIQPLAHTRYDFPAAVGPRVSGLTFGPVPTDLYSLLSSAANGSGSIRQFGGSKTCIVTVGKSPCLAAFEAEERPNKSTLAAIVGMASSLTSGVAGAASKAAGFGPSMMYLGARSLMRPLSSWYPARSASSCGPTPAAAGQPVVSYDDTQQLPKPEAVSLSRQLRDDERVLEALVPAPAGTLMVAPDNLGRVLLLEGGSMAVVRMWKGYRDAQCGWIMPPVGHVASPLELLLVLLAPKRQALEVWLPRSGQCLASRTVDYPCLLVPVGLPCGGWGNDRVLDAWKESCRCATTLVINLKSGEAWDAMECLHKE